MYTEDKIHLVYGPWNEEHFDSVQLELDLLDDMMWEAGYAISYSDLYKAWMAGNDGVWEHPYDYDDDALVVESVLEYCTALYDEPDPMEGLPEASDYSDVYEPMSQAEFDQIWDLLEQETQEDAYTGNARAEGAPWDPEADNTDPLEKAVFN